MINNFQTLENEFNSIITKVLNKEGLYIKTSSNVTTYKKYVIIKKDNAYIIKHNDKTIYKCCLKVVAFCVVKLHDIGNFKDIKEILHLDKQYIKIFNRITFMTSTYQTCTDELYKNSLEDRIEYFTSVLLQIKQKINTIWYYSINIETVFRSG